MPIINVGTESELYIKFIIYFPRTEGGRYCDPVDRELIGSQETWFHSEFHDSCALRLGAIHHITLFQLCSL